MGLVDKIKNEAKKTGSNKGKFIFFPEGKKVRIRFLADMDDGIEVKFHDSFEAGINVPCQELYGRDCPYCEDEDLRTRNLYAWPVWDYESKEVKIFMFAVNNCSPVPALMAMYENYGTLLDRDYVLTVTGKQQNKTFSVVPQDKAKFRNTKAAALSERQMLKIIDKAYPADEVEDDDYDEEDEKPKKKGNKSVNKSSGKKGKDEYDEDDDYDEDDEWEDEEEDDTPDYSEMSAKELYKLCKERDIDVLTKKSEKYYIKKLEEYDEAHDDWESDDEDEWEDEE